MIPTEGYLAPLLVWATSDGRWRCVVCDVVGRKEGESLNYLYVITGPIGCMAATLNLTLNPTRLPFLPLFSLSSSFPSGSCSFFLRLFLLLISIFTLTSGGLHHS